MNLPSRNIPTTHSRYAGRQLFRISLELSARECNEKRWSALYICSWADRRLQVISWLHLLFTAAATNQPPHRCRIYRSGVYVRLKFHGSSVLSQHPLVRHVRHARGRFPRDTLATSSRGCHDEDATRKLFPCNFSWQSGVRVSFVAETRLIRVVMWRRKYNVTRLIHMKRAHGMVSMWLLTSVWLHCHIPEDIMRILFIVQVTL